ncbi:uncharacterized protein LOC141530950 [Cotesia typhae]|uniref:uncharacterized protein LOC141528641 n=1 Tax=Cotesia typhae TaxID=2053667 RepID=UPI003D68200A
MPKQLRHQGQFVKNKNLSKKLSFNSDMKKAKEKKKESTKNNNLEGRRIVEYSELGKNLKCFKCRQVLSLENIEKEQLRGLHSQLWIKCENCFCVTQVMTGKVHDGNKNSKVFDVNSKIVLGAVHAGVGHTALNKILACLNVPQISDTLFKRYEREVGPAIEKAAEESCKKAAQEERHLIIENIDKLCEEL